MRPRLAESLSSISFGGVGGARVLTKAIDSFGCGVIMVVCVDNGILSWLREGGRSVADVAATL